PAPTTAVPVPESTTTQGTATSARAAQAPAEAGAPGGPVPRGIRLLDFTFVTPDQGWLLADATCSSPPCTSVLRTTDGGTSWVGVPAPRVGTSYPCAKPCGEHPWVDSLRFADRTNGWAYHTS